MVTLERFINPKFLEILRKMAEKKPTEKEIEEGKERQREISRLNLDDSYLTGLAVAKIGTPENYGKLLEGIYEQTIAKAPNQESYENLFLPALQNSENGVVINEPYLKTQATKIIQESLFKLPVNEILNRMGVSDEVSKSYTEKDIADLSEKDAGLIISIYLKDMVERVIEERLPEMRKSRVSALEKILTSDSE